MDDDMPTFQMLGDKGNDSNQIIGNVDGDEEYDNYVDGTSKG